MTKGFLRLVEKYSNYDINLSQREDKTYIGKMESGLTLASKSIKETEGMIKHFIKMGYIRKVGF